MCRRKTVWPRFTYASRDDAEPVSECERRRVIVDYTNDWKWRHAKRRASQVVSAKRHGRHSCYVWSDTAINLGARFKAPIYAESCAGQKRRHGDRLQRF